MTDTRPEATKRTEQPSAGTTPANATEANSAKTVEKTGDEINAEQIEAAKAAGKEYQGKPSPEEATTNRASLKDLAVEKGPASGAEEQA